jgi:hypothetical protein
MGNLGIIETDAKLLGIILSQYFGNKRLPKRRQVDIWPEYLYGNVDWRIPL